MIKFEPLLKQTLWGGSKIIPFKHLDAQLENVGESWEISGVSGNETIVANGQYKGMSLNQLVRELKGSLDDVKELTFVLTDLEYVSSAGLRVLLMAQFTLH